MTRRPYFANSSNLLRPAKPAPAIAPSGNVKAHDGNRTRDLFLTKEVLFRLSYMGKSQLPHAKTNRREQQIGAGNGPRSRDPEPGRLALYQPSYSRSPALLVERGGFEPPKA